MFYLWNVSGLYLMRWDLHRPASRFGVGQESLSGHKSVEMSQRVLKPLCTTQRICYISWLRTRCWYILLCFKDEGNEATAVWRPISFFWTPTEATIYTLSLLQPIRWNPLNTAKCKISPVNSNLETLNLCIRIFTTMRLRWNQYLFYVFNVNSVYLGLCHIRLFF